MNKIGDVSASARSKQPLNMEILMSRASIAEYVLNANEGMSKKQAEATVKAVFDGLAEEVIKTGRVQLPGFGTFATQDKPARTGRNPRTGESVEIKAKRVVKFKAGKELSEKVDG